MNPLALIGSAGVVSAIAGAVFLAMQWFGAYTAMVETATINRIAAAVSEQVRENDEKVAKIRDAARDKLSDQKDDYEVQARADKEKIDALFFDLEERMAADPFNADIDLARTLYLSMCKVAAGRDNGAREACHILAAEAGAPTSTAVISITPKTIGDWEAQCEATGEAQYCNYRVVSFHITALRELVGWIKDVDRALYEYDANDDAIRDQIRQIINMPGPEIK